MPARSEPCGLGEVASVHATTNARTPRMEMRLGSANRFIAGVPVKGDHLARGSAVKLRGSTNVFLPVKPAIARIDERLLTPKGDLALAGPQQLEFSLGSRPFPTPG